MVIRQGDAIIRLYYQKDPDKLSDFEWAKLIQEWNFCKSLEITENENQVARIKNVLIELANALYGKK